MFFKNSAASKKTPAKIVPPSIISTDMEVIGDLNSKGEIQIDGSVSGDINCKSLLVGKGAEITGGIIVERIEVHGKVIGQIKAKFVKLAKSAHVIGDVLHEELAIETGAFLEGHCKHTRIELPSEDRLGNHKKVETLNVTSYETSNFPEKSISKIADKSIDKPIDKPSDKPIDKPAAKI